MSQRNIKFYVDVSWGTNDIEGTSRIELKREKEIGERASLQDLG